MIDLLLILWITIILGVLFGYLIRKLSLRINHLTIRIGMLANQVAVLEHVVRSGTAKTHISKLKRTVYSSSQFKKRRHVTVT